MRVIVFFDLPIDTAENRREYAKFRRSLIKEGFMMLQKSVYVKLAMNQNSAASISAKLKGIKPSSGLVQVLTVTEKQFEKMEILTGEFKSDVLDNSDRVVIL